MSRPLGWVGLGLLAAMPMGIEACANVQVAKTLQAAGVNARTARMIEGGTRVVQGMMPIGYKEEMAIGGALALQAVSRFGGVYNNDALQHYIALVGSAVARTSDRPDIPYYFAVLNDETPNAFACPGGYIFVTKGLLRLVQNEAQLAGILGHEIAHVAKKHALEIIRRSKMLAGASEVTLAALDQNPAMFDKVIQEASTLIFDHGLDKGKELEADRLGSVYAMRVGYNSAGLETFLEILEVKLGHQKTGVSKTHPDPAVRVSELKRDFSGPLQRGLRYPLLPEPFHVALAQAHFQ